MKRKINSLFTISVYTIRSQMHAFDKLDYFFKREYGLTFEPINVKLKCHYIKLYILSICYNAMVSARDGVDGFTCASPLPTSQLGCTGTSF